MTLDPRLLAFTGFILIILGMVVVMLSIRGRGLGSTTGFILLGPIPIVWRGSKAFSLLILIPIIIALLFLSMVILR